MISSGIPYCVSVSGLAFNGCINTHCLNVGIESKGALGTVTP